MVIRPGEELWGRSIDVRDTLFGVHSIFYYLIYLAHKAGKGKKNLYHSIARHLLML